MSELLPCPFCGGTPKIYETMESLTVIECGCGMVVSEALSWRSDLASMIEGWNTRAPSPTPVTVSEEMVEVAIKAYSRHGETPKWSGMKTALIAALTTNKKG